MTEKVVGIHVRTSWCDSVAPDVATLSLELSISPHLMLEKAGEGPCDSVASDVATLARAARVSPHVGRSGLRAQGCRGSVPQGEKNVARALDTGQALATDALPADVTIRPHNYIV